jgi:hypothetical protein
MNANDEAYMFETVEDWRRNKNARRWGSVRYGYGSAFKINCRRCKAEVFSGDYGNGTGARYVAIWAREAKEGHYNLCIRG